MGQHKSVKDEQGKENRKYLHLVLTGFLIDLFLVPYLLWYDHLKFWNMFLGCHQQFSSPLQRMLECWRSLAGWTLEEEAWHWTLWLVHMSSYSQSICILDLFPPRESATKFQGWSLTVQFLLFWIGHWYKQGGKWQTSAIKISGKSFLIKKIE